MDRSGIALHKQIVEVRMDMVDINCIASNGSYGLLSSLAKM